MKNGGPAFLVTLENEPKESFSGSYGGKGMSLRDYFAEMALNGFMANKVRPTYFMPEDDAAYMYKIADAMLAEREKEGNQ